MKKQFFVNGFSSIVIFLDKTWVLSLPSNNEECFWTASALHELKSAFNKDETTSGDKTALYFLFLIGVPCKSETASLTIFVANLSKSNLDGSESKKISPPDLISSPSLTTTLP